MGPGEEGGDNDRVIGGVDLDEFIKIWVQSI